MTPESRSAAHDVPHVLPQLDVDARGRLVEEQDLRIVRERLRDHHAPLHAARERHDLVRPSCPRATASCSTFSTRAGSRGLPNRPRLKVIVSQTVSNASVVSSCGTRPISERAAR